MRHISLPIYILIIGLLMPTAILAAPSDSMPLKITGKFANKPAYKSAQLETPGYTLSIKNDSQKTVTAWNMTCLQAKGDGNFATTTLERDAVFRYERGSAAGDGLVPPGSVFDLVVPRAERMLHPYQAMSCRVAAVIFADGSHSGEPRAIAGLFQRRARIANDASRTINILNQMLATGPSSSGDPLAGSVAALEAELSRGGNWYTKALRQALEAARAGDSAGSRARLSDLLAVVNEEHSAIKRHLPSQGEHRVPPTPPMKHSLNLVPGNKLRQDEGCILSGGSTGESKTTCSGSFFDLKRLAFSVSASCQNPCTGSSWQVNSPTTTITGVCPSCTVDYLIKDGQNTVNINTERFYSEGFNRVIDQGLCKNDSIGTSAVTCNCPGCGNPSPILISLSDDRYQLTDAVGGVQFDLDADGKAEQTAWTALGSDEGFLALDRNLNGTIDDYMEIFGDHTPQLPSNEPNGWLALAVWDDSLNGGNEDGIIDVNDYIFTALQIWVDGNHNGISEPEELSSLEEVGLDYLELDYGRSNRMDKFGNAFKFWAEVGMTDGRVIIAWDVFFVHL